ncbi:Inositol 2-dehydrogenase/D-chiro-inositol 3-dehydrogenase [Methylobacterium crusticola]|uniref:Inositol 2-dehydrogenase/D-chiro-inositol 3-dehydrogenase n=1 Tax=Methylobacterium crusticola TaxID=1697972 RepID=A0ABQ4QWN6_9HYPH|nr:Gfo/Idh/MocA family oxidoreductase [Methylobacterium crusticola]GJD49797.1 Inositol 2-dehydrogenase/D-chiro-inositol 3-dehydrogenase [Methylobacterium crusticola]
MASIGIVGAGYVADYYMRSFETTPDIEVVGVWDIDPDRLSVFCTFWDVPAVNGMAELLAKAPDLILNLTNPDSHYAVSLACLESGVSVYSEKPLATRFDDARHLHEVATRKGLMLASAPCSLLGETAQTVWKALREQAIGTPRLVYAEIDDGFVPRAPYDQWRSESGAPWPAQDEFAVGCTLEHAGYYLTWLIAMFGSVKRVVSASADVLGLTLEDGSEAAPTYASASLFFEGGVVARLTCSIVAPHDHSLRIFGDEGILEVGECWSNDAPVRIRRRHVLRRRLLDSPVTRRVRLRGPTHPKVGRRGATAMNFALGPQEVLAARAEGRPCRLDADLALHLTEVTLAIQNAGDRAGGQVMTSRAPAMAPMPWAVG